MDSLLKLIKRMVCLILTLVVGDNSAINEIRSLEIELNNVYVTDIIDNQSIEYHDNAYFVDDVLVFYPQENRQEFYAIPEGTIAILPRAFTYNTFIKEIQCPSSLVLIGSRAFRQTPLERINLESVLYIGSSAFEGTSLTKVTLSKEIKWIGTYAFWGIRIKRTSHLILPDTLVYIGDDIMVSGTSSYDSFTPIFDVYDGSVGYQWANENGYNYSLLHGEQ